METTNTTTISGNAKSEFTTVPGVYEISGSKMDITDQIACRIQQLEAMLAMTFGESGESFRNMNDDLQDNFMWSCSSAIKEIRQLLDLLLQEESGDAPSPDPT
jgi:hypothetical protein